MSRGIFRQQGQTEEARADEVLADESPIEGSTIDFALAATIEAPPETPRKRPARGRKAAPKSEPKPPKSPRRKTNAGSTWIGRAGGGTRTAKPPTTDSPVQYVEAERPANIGARCELARRDGPFTINRRGDSGRRLSPMSRPVYRPGDFGAAAGSGNRRRLRMYQRCLHTSPPRRPRKRFRRPDPR